MAVLFRASTTGTLGTRREIVECMATLSTEFPAAVAALLPTVTADNMHKLMSAVEGVVDSSRDPQTQAGCTDMLRVFAQAANTANCLEVLIDSGCAEFALRMARTCIQDPESASTATASAVGLCAALCTGSSSAAKRATTVFLSGDAQQVIAQAVQNISSNTAAAAPEVVASCADFTMRLTEAVIAEDSAAGVTEVTPRLQAMQGLVKRIVTVAGAATTCSGNAQCMESVLGLVVSTCTGGGAETAAAKQFGESVMSTLLESDVKSLLVSAMSSVSVSEAVLKAGRRATVLLDRRALAAAVASGGSGGAGGADVAVESEGLAEAVLRCVAAVKAAGDAAKASPLGELATALRMLSASLAAEEALDKPVGRFILDTLQQACVAVAAATTGVPSLKVPEDVFTAQRDVVSLCAQLAGRLYSMATSPDTPEAEDVPIQHSKYCGKSKASLASLTTAMGVAEVLQVLEVAVGLAVNWSAGVALERAGLCALVYEGTLRTLQVLVDLRAAAVVPILSSGVGLVITRVYDALLDGRETAPGAWQSLRVLRNILLELVKLAKSNLAALYGKGPVDRAIPARMLVFAASASFDPRSGDFTGSAAAPNELTQSATVLIGAVRQGNPGAVEVLSAMAEVQRMITTFSDSRGPLRRLALLKEATRACRVCGQSLFSLR